MEPRTNQEPKEFTEVLKSFLPKFSCPKKDKCCKNYKDGKQCKRCPKR
jgi:hypothetical protein